MALSFRDLRNSKLLMLKTELAQAAHVFAKQTDEAVLIHAAGQLEKACYAVLGPQISREVYVHRCEMVRDTLLGEYGEFLETTLAEQFLAGLLTATEVVTDGVLSGPTGERQRCRAMFYRTLGKDPGFGSPETDGRRRDYASRIERSCYNAAIKSCIVSEDALLRSWKSEAFVGVYSARCGTLNCNLDRDSSVVRQHGAFALARLLSGEWSPDAMGEYASTKLCPQAGQREREEITLRNQQRVVEKSSRLYRCPNCRARDCVYREVQTRGLDESATIFCTCRQCGAQFNG